ncbi:MAG: AMP-binding protein, partial [Bdellovibrionales bacterium]|nr:AMP-binding protein [Bdellovibrionales bacterium]
FIDASLLLASIERPVRFLMYRPIYESRIINPLARRMKAIPIASGDGRKGIEKSLEYARELIEEGEIVGIFAEGAITRTGGMLPFKSGFETIMKGSTAPIIPAHIDRLWGSIFSFRRGKAFFKIPREIPYPVTVSFGEPLDSSANANEVRSAVECLSAKAFALRPGLNSTLAESFILQTKKSPFRKALRGNKKLFRYLHLSGRALSISSALVRNSVPEANLFLSVANRFEAALAHIAGVLSGKKILHLARNAPCKELAATLSGTIIIKTFSEASSLQSDESLPWIKLNSLGGSIESALWQFAILLIPIQLWRRFFANSRHITPNSVAYLLSTTQSIENPKLVKLEHKNVLANIEGLTEVFDIESHDVFAGILPLSYSLAVGPAFWLPLLRGAAISYPAIDTEFNLDWLSKEEITVLIATPMLADRLLNETKESKNLASLPRKLALRRAFVGGDVVRENLLREFHEKIGVRLDEGYGCAEIGAVGLINLRDFGEGKAAQKGTKVGSAGVPVPGLAVRIVSSQGMVELPHGTVGELQFYGVCISTSYALIESNSDVDVLNEQGWFESKDFGVRDEDGFVRVLGPWYRTLLVDNTRYDLR